MVYEISYDLNKPKQNYPKLYEAIKSFGNWCHPLDSTWFVVSSLSALDIANKLWAQMDSNDSLIVARVSSAAWVGLSKEVADWLKENVAYASVR